MKKSLGEGRSQFNLAACIAQLLNNRSPHPSDYASLTNLAVDFKSRNEEERASRSPAFGTHRQRSRLISVTTSRLFFRAELHTQTHAHLPLLFLQRKHALSGVSTAVSWSWDLSRLDGADAVGVALWPCSHMALPGACVSEQRKRRMLRSACEGFSGETGSPARLRSAQKEAESLKLQEVFR